MSLHEGERVARVTESLNPQELEKAAPYLVDAYYEALLEHPDFVRQSADMLWVGANAYQVDEKGYDLRIDVGDRRFAIKRNSGIGTGGDEEVTVLMRKKEGADSDVEDRLLWLDYYGKTDLVLQYWDVRASVTIPPQEMDGSYEQATISYQTSDASLGVEPNTFAAVNQHKKLIAFLQQNS